MYADAICRRIEIPVPPLTSDSSSEASGGSPLSSTEHFELPEVTKVDSGQACVPSKGYNIDCNKMAPRASSSPSLTKNLPPVRSYEWDSSFAGSRSMLGAHNDSELIKYYYKAIELGDGDSENDGDEGYHFK